MTMLPHRPARRGRLTVRLESAGGDDDLRVADITYAPPSVVLGRGYRGHVSCSCGMWVEG